MENIIRAVFGLEKCFHILVIDDGSPDGTAQIVHRLIKEEFADRLFIIERSGKLGLGTAYICGFKWALEHGYDYIFEMDADFSHDPNDLPRLYAATHDEGFDVAVGSRYVSGVNVVNWPIGRVLMSYFASKYVRFVTGFHVHDTTAGFVCYRRKVLETIPLDEVRFKGYAFQIEMKYTAYKIGFKIKEVQDERRHILGSLLWCDAFKNRRLVQEISRYKELNYSIVKERFRIGGVLLYV